MKGVRNSEDIYFDQKATLAVSARVRVLILQES